MRVAALCATYVDAMKYDKLLPLVYSLICSHLFVLEGMRGGWMGPVPSADKKKRQSKMRSNGRSVPPPSLYSLHFIVFRSLFILLPLQFLRYTLNVRIEIARLLSVFICSAAHKGQHKANATRIYCEISYRATSHCVSAG